MDVHRHTYDAVIVGAGGAGLRAAIEVAGRCRTAVLTKLYPDLEEDWSRKPV